MSHSEYSASNPNIHYNPPSIHQAFNPNPLSPVQEHPSTRSSLDPPLNPATPHSLFPITPLSTPHELTMRRQQVHSWPLDSRASLALPHQRLHHRHQDPTSPSNILSPYAGRRTPPYRHQHSHPHPQPSTQPNTARGTFLPWALAGSLDPTTGIFYRTPENPRLRTAQACEKCRTRKAKCSGEHPTCNRCLTRGLICEYAKEGRMRGPNRPKIKDHATEGEDPTHPKRSSPLTTPTVASATDCSTTTVLSGRKHAPSNSSSKAFTHTLGSNDKDKIREREKKHPLPLFVTAPRAADYTGHSTTCPAPLTLDTTPVDAVNVAGAPVLSSGLVDGGVQGFDGGGRNSYTLPLLPPVPGSTTSIRGGQGEMHGFSVHNEALGVGIDPGTPGYGIAYGQPSEDGNIKVNGQRSFVDASYHQRQHYSYSTADLTSSDGHQEPATPSLHLDPLSNPFAAGFGSHDLSPVSAFHHQDAHQQDGTAIFRPESRYRLRGHDYHQAQKEHETDFDIHERDNLRMEHGMWSVQASAPVETGLRMGFQQQQDSVAEVAAVGPQLDARWGEVSVEANGQTFGPGQQRRHEPSQRQQVNGGGGYPIEHRM